VFSELRLQEVAFHFRGNPLIVSSAAFFSTYNVRKIRNHTTLRRGISGAVTAIIVVILVAAVGVGAYYVGTSTAPSPATTTTTTTTTASTVIQTPVTITVWETYAPSSSKSSEFGAFNASLTAFKLAYPWITVNVQTHAFGSEQSDFTTASLANQAPDVIRVSNDWTGAFVAEGFLTPINSFVNSTFLSNYFNASIADYSYGGHLWGLPENVNGLGLYYNKALVPTPPTTTDQLVGMAQSITKYDSTCKITTAGIVMANAGGFESGYEWWPFLAGFGGSVFSTTNPTMPVINSSQAVASVEFLDGLVTNPNPNTSCDGVMPPSIDSTTALNLFTSGQAGMLIDGPWDASTINSSGISFGVTAMPTVTSTGLPLAPFLGSQGWEIASGKSSAETLASFEFISFITNFNSQKNLVTLAGDLPANPNLAKDPSVTGNPIDVGFLAQAATSSAAVNIPEMGIVYSNLGGPLGLAEPSTSTSPVSAAQIQMQLNAAEAACIRAIGSA
jgi:arabinogalactan oligomer / maltooligosaccharide transport system substrate-binding protein